MYFSVGPPISLIAERVLINKFFSDNIPQLPLVVLLQSSFASTLHERLSHEALTMLRLVNVSIPCGYKFVEDTIEQVRSPPSSFQNLTASF